MDDRLTDSIAQPRFTAVLLAVFAGLALLLASVGIYGVMACVVRGASQRDWDSPCARRRTGTGAGHGDGAGAIHRRAWSGLRRSGCFGPHANLEELPDPATIIGVSIALAAVAMIACYLPARRALDVDPAIVLRYD